MRFSRLPLALARSSGSLRAHAGAAAVGRPLGGLGGHARLAGGWGQVLAGPQQVYDEIGAGLPEGATYSRPGELPDQRENIEISGLFEPVLVRHIDWEVAYDTDGYIGLFDTFSGHIA